MKNEFVVIILDDDKQILEMIYECLISRYKDSISVIKCKTLKELDVIYKDSKFDILISDINLPDGNAYERLIQISKPIIFISGFMRGLQDDELRHKYFLEKPFSMFRIFELIEKIRNSI